MSQRVPVTQTDDRRVIAGLVLWLLAGCQAAPTVVRQTDVPAVHGAATPAQVLESRPAILDARSPLDFGVSHVPGAVNVAWTDFTQPGAKSKGLLDSDDVALARRLALWGIDRETPVLVLGDGPMAHGEEGWIAWMIESLGVKTVHVGTPGEYRGQIPRPDERLPNRPFWKPEVRGELRATPAEGRKFLSGSPLVSRAGFGKARTQALGAVPPAVLSSKRVVLDVRAPEEINALPLSLFAWKGERLAVPWREFFDPQGRPAAPALEKLKAVGWTGHEEILVVSEHGLESGAVTYALKRLGFGEPRNLIAGLRGLGPAK